MHVLWLARCGTVLLLGCAASAARADGPAPTAPPAVAAPAFADVAARVRQHDAPLWLHLRIEADGRFAVRSAVDAEAVTWTQRGAWQFAGIPEADAEALRVLEAGLENALTAEPRPVGLVAFDGHSQARLLIDVDAEVPWRRVQWAVQSACAPKLKLWHLTFLAPGAATWVDVDLPKDRGIVDGPVRRVRSFEVKMFRKGLGEPTAAQFTRLRVMIREEDVSAGGVPKGSRARAPEPKVLTGGGVSSPEAHAADESGRTVTIDLPPGSAPSDARAAAWSRLSEQLAQSVDELPVEGEIKTPPPTGGAVPCSDVIEAIVRLRQAGCPTVLLEGAPPPMPRR